MYYGNMARRCALGPVDIAFIGGDPHPLPLQPFEVVEPMLPAASRSSDRTDVLAPSISADSERQACIRFDPSEGHRECFS